MGLLVFIAIVIVLLALAVYAIRLLPVLDEPFKLILQILAVLCAILVIANRAGVF